MAYTKLWPITGSLSSSGMIVSKVIKYDKNEAKTVKADTNIKTSKTFSGGEISNVINYTSNSVKTGEKKYVTTINCTEEKCIDEMLMTKRRYDEKGRRIMYHGVQSFKPGEIDRNSPELAHQLGIKLAKELWGSRFEVVVTTHLDREHIHNHFAINSVSFIDGKKLDWDKEYRKMREVSDRLCRENALSIISENEFSGHVHRGAMRAESEGRYTIESIVKEDIDTCIKCSKNLDEWFALMKGKGYRIDPSGKYLKVFPYRHSKCIRVDRRFLAKYGKDYSLSGIAEMIADNILDGGYEKPEEDMLRIPEEVESVGYIIEPAEDDEDYHDFEYENMIRPFKEFGYKMPRQVSGYQRIYNRYLILLGVHPARSVRRNARTHYLLREDLLKLDRYIAENNLLISRNITNAATLSSTKNIEKTRLSEVETARKKIRNKIRRAEKTELPEMLEKLADMNREIKDIRRTVYYLNDIEKSIQEMKEKVEKARDIQRETDRSYGNVRLERKM